MQRHTAARQVNFRLKHSRHAFKKFAELIVEPNLEQRLADAVRNLQSDNAKELVRKVVPLTCMIGSSVPYSTAAQNLLLAIYRLHVSIWYGIYFRIRCLR